MDFTYTDELDYYLVIFNIEDIPFSAQIDKESKQVIDISTMTNGVFNASHPYNINTPLKQINWLPVSYFDIEDVLVEFFKNEC